MEGMVWALAVNELHCLTLYLPATLQRRRGKMLVVNAG